MTALERKIIAEELIEKVWNISWGILCKIWQFIAFNAQDYELKCFQKLNMMKNKTIGYAAWKFCSPQIICWSYIALC